MSCVMRVVSSWLGGGVKGKEQEEGPGGRRSPSVVFWAMTCCARCSALVRPTPLINPWRCEYVWVCKYV